MIGSDIKEILYEYRIGWTYERLLKYFDHWLCNAVNPQTMKTIEHNAYKIWYLSMSNRNCRSFFWTSSSERTWSVISFDEWLNNDLNCWIKYEMDLTVAFRCLTYWSWSYIIKISKWFHILKFRYSSMIFYQKLFQLSSSNGIDYEIGVLGLQQNKKCWNGKKHANLALLFHNQFRLNFSSRVETVASSIRNSTWGYGTTLRAL